MDKRGLVLGQTIRKGKLQRAKELRRNMTSQEAVLWEELRANRLHGLHFRRQHIIHGFIVDFYCHAAALVIEVDGAVHDDRQDYDSERARLLEQRGLRILRFRNAEVATNLQTVLQRIADACLERPPFPPREGG